MKSDIVIDYIGGALSTNGCWIRGRGGVRVNAYKPEVKLWMQILADKSRPLKGQLREPVYIVLSGRFKDLRHPDLDNLFKVSCDGLKHGLGIDDKYFRMSAGDIVIDSIRDSVLLFEISDEPIQVANKNESGGCLI